MIEIIKGTAGYVLVVAALVFVGWLLTLNDKGRVIVLAADGRSVIATCKTDDAVGCGACPSGFSIVPAEGRNKVPEMGGPRLLRCLPGGAP